MPIRQISLLSICFLIFFLSGQNVRAGDEGEAIAATITQLIPKVVDEQVVTIKLGAGLNNEFSPLASVGGDIIYVRSNILIGISMTGTNSADSMMAPRVYGGLLIGQRRFNANVGKYYVDLLLGGGIDKNEETIWVAEPRFDIVVKQSRKLFIPDFVVNNTFGVKLGASLRIVSDENFSNIVEQSAAMVHIGLFIGRYSD